MWAHRPWIGSFHPASTAPNRLLAAYASCFHAVEGNTTFYAVPNPDTVSRWAEQTPESFRFVFKFPRRITHDLRLRNAQSEVDQFLEVLALLDGQLGPTFVQLPASFGPRDLEALDSFLDALPSDFSIGVEVRHREFFAGGGHEQALDSLLRERNADRVILDARCVHAGPADTEQERDEIRSKPNLPVRPVATADHPIVRFIGQTAPDANPPYWERWVDTCVRWLDEGLEPYLFVHTPDNLASPHLARRFHDAVALRVPGLAPLPAPFADPPEPPEQRLFD
jgi:uncharacterized protein YecE (DUF72 family)